MDPEEPEIRLQAREVCELFKGRFKEEEMVMVIKEFGGKLPAVDFILKEDPEVVSQFMKKSKSYVIAMQEDSKKLSSCLDEWVTIESSKRQFACKTCVRFWWKRVPIRKEVSRCRKCQTKYDPVPRENEWGLGVFYCLTENCEKEFLEYAVMNMSESVCFRCKYPSPVDHILPPFKKDKRDQGWRNGSKSGRTSYTTAASGHSDRRTWGDHNCNGVNCYKGVGNPKQGQHSYWSNAWTQLDTRQNRNKVLQLTRKATKRTFLLLTIVNMDPEEQEIPLQARQLCELFHGRFKQDEMIIVISELGGQRQALDFILNGDPKDVSHFMKKSVSYVTSLQEDSKKLCRYLEEVITIVSSERQFACKACKRCWWKRVPIRKEVNKCVKCKVKYDPVPRDKEWGFGQFYCLGDNCAREYKGYAVMGMTESMCKRCGFYSPVDHIIPPRREVKETSRRSKGEHSCNGINCYNRSGNPNEGIYNNLRNGRQAVCIHPKSLKMFPDSSKYVTWSENHRSTGSTISTFLDQRSLDTNSGVFVFHPK